MEGLERLRASDHEIALVVSDVVMPRMSGPELHQAARRNGAEAKFVFVTGYTSSDAGAWAGLDPAVPLLKKPWTIPELLEVVRKALESETNGN
jgi:DNA-binding NtrC family response regulator